MLFLPVKMESSYSNSISLASDLCSANLSIDMAVVQFATCRNQSKYLLQEQEIRLKRKKCFNKSRTGQLFSSAGHIVSLFVARGPDFSQKG
jgi:hypothetical protein